MMNQSIKEKDEQVPPKRQTVRYLPEEEDWLFDCMKARRSLRSVQVEQLHHQVFNRKLKHDASRSEVGQLIKRRNTGETLRQRNQSTSLELAEP